MGCTTLGLFPGLASDILDQGLKFGGSIVVVGFGFGCAYREGGRLSSPQAAGGGPEHVPTAAMGGGPKRVPTRQLRLRLRAPGRRMEPPCPPWGLGLGTGACVLLGSPGAGTLRWAAWLGVGSGPELDPAGRCGAAVRGQPSARGEEAIRMARRGAGVSCL